MTLKSRLLLLVLSGWVLLWAQPASAWTKIDGKCGFTNNASAALTLNTVGADLILVAGICDNGCTIDGSKYSDTVGITYTARTQYGNGVGLAYAWQGSTGWGTSATDTITFNPASGFPVICAESWSGALTSGDPYDSAENGNTDCNASTCQTGSVSTSSGSLIISAIFTYLSTSGWAIDSSFTVSETQATDSATHYSGAMAYKQQTGSSENPTWSGYNSWSHNAASIAVFKPGGGGGGGTTPCILGGGIIRPGCPGEDVGNEEHK